MASRRNGLRMNDYLTRRNVEHNALPRRGIVVIQRSTSFAGGCSNRNGVHFPLHHQAFLGEGIR